MRYLQTDAFLIVFAYEDIVVFRRQDGNFFYPERNIHGTVPPFTTTNLHSA